MIHITHFWAEDKVTFAATEQGMKFTTDSSIADLEEKLTPKGFIRIHRNTLVNQAFIAEFHRWFAGRMLVSLKNKNWTASKSRAHRQRSCVSSWDCSSTSW